MRLKHLLLCLLLVTVSVVQAQDCAPASMQYIAKSLNFDFTLEQAMDACQTDEVGTDIDNIMPAWEKLTKYRSQMIPIYVMPPIGNLLLDRKLAPYRALNQIDKPVQIGELKYLWVGLRKDADGQFYSHCAVVIFLENGVKMISPNSQDSDGKVVEETLGYKEFFSRTFIVFDVVINPRRLITL